MTGWWIENEALLALRSPLSLHRPEFIRWIFREGRLLSMGNEWLTMLEIS